MLAHYFPVGADPPETVVGNHDDPGAVEHGKPFLFGPPEERRGLVLEGLRPKVVRVQDVPDNALWVHDETDRDSGFILSQLWAPDYPIPIGVLNRDDAATVYEELVIQQEQKTLSERGPGDIVALLRSGETWTIK